MIFGLMALPLFGAVGGAVDFMNFGRMRTIYQNGLDAAVLAAARAKQIGRTDDEALQVARNHMASLRDNVSLEGTATFRIVENGTAIDGATDLSLPTKFLAVLGFRSIPLVTASRARFGVGSASGTNIEISLMLDVTGSMRGTKIVDMKAAARDLIDIIVPDNPGRATARIALAPFSNSVRVDSNVFRAVTGKEPNRRRNYDGCVVERTGAEAYTDAAPGVGAYVVPIEDVSRASCADDYEVVPLTDNKQRLNHMVDAFWANGTTAGHLGTAWAWYLLSPNWADAFGPQSAPAPYSDLTVKNAAGEPKLKKIAVLMTDGEYNTEYSRTGSTEQARRLCTEMKKTGIEVYTVGFDLGGNTTAIETLRNCASDPMKFYETSTGEELKSAFSAIALQIAPIKLVR